MKDLIWSLDNSNEYRYTWTQMLRCLLCNKKKSSVNLVLLCDSSSYPIRHYWIIFTIPKNLCRMCAHTANAAIHTIYVQRHPLTVSTIFDVLSDVDSFAFLLRCICIIWEQRAHVYHEKRAMKNTKSPEWIACWF